MNYLNYVIAAYTVFVVVLGWDFAATRLQIRRELRNARLRAARKSGNEPARAPSNELGR